MFTSNDIQDAIFFFFFFWFQNFNGYGFTVTGGIFFIMEVWNSLTDETKYTLQLELTSISKEGSSVRCFCSSY